MNNTLLKNGTTAVSVHFWSKSVLSSDAWIEILRCLTILATGGPCVFETSLLCSGKYMDLSFLRPINPHFEVEQLDYILAKPYFLLLIIFIPHLNSPLRCTSHRSINGHSYLIHLGLALPVLLSVITAISPIIHPYPSCSHSKSLAISHPIITSSFHPFFTYPHL